MKFLGIPKIPSWLTAAMNNKFGISKEKPFLIQPVGLRLAEELGASYESRDGNKNLT
jgi:hypothetical protein